MAKHNRGVDVIERRTTTDYDNIKIDEDKRNLYLLKAAKALSKIETLDQWRKHRSEIYDIGYQIERIETEVRGKKY